MYKPFNGRAPQTSQERQCYERLMQALDDPDHKWLMQILLDDPDADPWDLWRCQTCLDGHG